MKREQIANWLLEENLVVAVNEGLVARTNFETTENGFKVKFKNGYTVSVQFGSMNYSNNKADCEIAVIDKNGKFAPRPDWGDDVAGYRTPEEMLEIMNWASKK
jgi:sulfur carrier protein ThiS